MMTAWIMPCNLKYFDIIERFKKYDYVIWKNGVRMLKGDIVYIYVGRPYSRIMFKCSVEDADVEKNVLDDNTYARIGDIEHNRKYMKLRKVHAYEDGITLAKLQELGLFGVRKQTRLDIGIVTYLNNIDSSFLTTE